MGMSGRGPAFMSMLSDDVLVKIVVCVSDGYPVRSLCHLARTCKRLQLLVDQDFVWNAVSANEIDRFPGKYPAPFLENTTTPSLSLKQWFQRELGLRDDHLEWEKTLPVAKLAFAEQGQHPAPFPENTTLKQWYKRYRLRRWYQWYAWQPIGTHRQPNSKQPT